MKKYKLGVLGAGNMGTAIADGAVRGGFFDASQILMFNRSSEKRQQKQALGYAVTADYTDVYKDCQWVILGVKPQNFDEILPNLAKCELSEKPLIISIAAGVKFDKIENSLGKDLAIVRIMPNTPLMMGLGASAIVGNDNVTNAEISAVSDLFGSMGVTAVFDKEDALNDVIPYNGSLPAFVYTMIDGFAQSASEHGIDNKQAIELICQTFIGSAKMVLEDGRTPAELTDAVCSKGGTTIEGIKIMQNANIKDIISKTCDATINRAYELGK